MHSHIPTCIYITFWIFCIHVCIRRKGHLPIWLKILRAQIVVLTICGVPNNFILKEFLLSWKSGPSNVVRCKASNIIMKYTILKLLISIFFSLYYLRFQYVCISSNHNLFYLPTRYLIGQHNQALWGFIQLNQIFVFTHVPLWSNINLYVCLMGSNPNTVWLFMVCWIH